MVKSSPILSMILARMMLTQKISSSTRCFVQPLDLLTCTIKAYFIAILNQTISFAQQTDKWRLLTWEQVSAWLKIKSTGKQRLEQLHGLHLRSLKVKFTRSKSTSIPLVASCMSWAKERHPSRHSWVVAKSLSLMPLPMLLKQISDVKTDHNNFTTCSLNAPRNRQVSDTLWMRCFRIPISKVLRTWKISGYKPTMLTFSGYERILVDSPRSMAFWTRYPPCLQHKLPRRQPPPQMKSNKMALTGLHLNRTTKLPTIMQPMLVPLHPRSKTLLPTQPYCQHKNPLPQSIPPLPPTQPKRQHKNPLPQSIPPLPLTLEFDWFRLSVLNLTATKLLTKNFEKWSTYFTSEQLSH